jgi:hypothetical protein
MERDYEISSTTVILQVFIRVEVPRGSSLSSRSQETQNDPSGTRRASTEPLSRRLRPPSAPEVAAVRWSAVKRADGVMA